MGTVRPRKADLTSVANPDPCLSDPWIRDPGRVKNQDADPEPESYGISESYRDLTRVISILIYRSRD
jgi:hypothetical protein